MGRSRSAVSNALRLLDLNEDVRALVERGDLDMGHARALLALSGAAQSEAAAEVVKRGLSARETEKLVRSKATRKSAPAPVTRDPDVVRIENRAWRTPRREDQDRSQGEEGDGLGHHPLQLARRPRRHPRTHPLKARDFRSAARSSTLRRQKWPPIMGNSRIVDPIPAGLPPSGSWQGRSALPRTGWPARKRKRPATPASPRPAVPVTCKPRGIPPAEKPQGTEIADRFNSGAMRSRLQSWFMDVTSSSWR